MPMYSYFCGKCNLTIERFLTVEQRRKSQECPSCETRMKFVEYPQDSFKPEGRADLRDPFRKI